MIRAIVGVFTIPIAITAFSTPCPSTAMIAIARTMYGNDSSTSTKRIGTASGHPPKYPVVSPSEMPRTFIRRIATEPTSSDTRVP